MSALLYIFTRAPVAGQVKTRLIAELGAEAAAALHCAFLDDVCALTRGMGERIVSVAGDLRHPFVVALAAREGMSVVQQADGDLGARMAAAIDDGLRRGAERVAILGSDAPAVPPAAVREALAALSEVDVVVAPAEDGGYWLVGARRPVPAMFADIAWSTPSVMATTHERLRAANIRYALGRAFWDVDDPADLARLRRHLAEDDDPQLAPATRALLRHL